MRYKYRYSRIFLGATSEFGFRKAAEGAVDTQCLKSMTAELPNPGNPGRGNSVVNSNKTLEELFVEISWSRGSNSMMLLFLGGLSRGAEVKLC